MKDFSFITNSSPAYIESLYNQFTENPESVDQDLRKFFEGFDFAVNTLNGKPVAAAKSEPSNLIKEFAVYQLIEAYRNKGHLIARTNPIRIRKDRGANLELKYFGLSHGDLDTEFIAGKFVGLGTASLQKILDHLNRCYAGSTGFEFSAITDSRKLEWIIKAAEE